MSLLTDLRAELRPALVALGVLSVVTGLAYPLAVTGVARVAFPQQARGSLVTIGDTIRGSMLIGQWFTSPRYLWGRPSAIAVPYDARSSAASNLGPTNPVLDSLVRSRVASLRATGAVPDARVPVDLVTSSGSGLDPDVTPAAAAYQVTRIAAARAIDPSLVQRAIAMATRRRTFDILGEPRVNVLQANLVLDSLTRASVAAHSLR